MHRLLATAPLAVVLVLAGCAGNGGAQDEELIDGDLDGFFANDPVEARRDCDDLPNRGEQVNPSIAEKCDGKDNDCDGQIDEDGALGALEWWPDGDADGFGIRVEAPRVACELPEGFAANRKDCNDGDPAIYPQALERCNELDDDCDLVVDEGFDPAATWHADADEDGYGAFPVVGRGCATDPSWVRDGSDCNDINRFVNPEADELCNGVDEDCDGLIDGADLDDLDVLKGARDWYPDGDGDGFGALVGQYVDTDGTVYLVGAIRSCPNEPPASTFVTDSSDCDDFDAAVNPTTTWFRDGDRDGHGDPDLTWPESVCWQPIGYVIAPDDCDDADADDWSTRRWYADADRDGFGLGATPVWEGCRPEGLPDDVWSADGGDCADRDPNRFPGAVELCDTLGPEGADLDQDCDGLVGDADPSVTGKARWFFDRDLDGYGTTFGGVDACRQPAGYAPVDGDCDDNDPARRPDAVWFVDQDRDGYGDPGTAPVASCDVVPGRVPNDDDCDDRAYAQTPDARWWTDADGDDLGVGITPVATGCVRSTRGLASWTGDCDDADAADDAGGCFGPQRGTFSLGILSDRDGPYSVITYGCLDASTDVEVLPERQFQLLPSDRGRQFTLDLGTLPSGSRCTVSVKTTGGDLGNDGPVTVTVRSCDRTVGTVVGDIGIPSVEITSPELLVERCSGCKDPAAENYDPTVILPTPPDQACIYAP